MKLYFLRGAQTQDLEVELLGEVETEEQLAKMLFEHSKRFHTPFKGPLSGLLLKEVSFTVQGRTYRLSYQ